MSRSLRHSALVVAATALVLLPLAGPAGATAPAPQPGFAPGAATTAFGTLQVFYQRADEGLTTKALTGGTWSTTDLGGSISTGPAPITIGSEFARTWVFAAGANHAVYRRVFSDGTGEWGPWGSIGGFTVGTPATSCVGDFTAEPVVWVVGADGALWRRATAAGGWARLGGRLGSEPAAVPAVAGVCPPTEDVVALGDDLAVWEHRASGWSRIGGRSSRAPSVVRVPGGASYVFVVGTDDVLYVASRPSLGAGWSGFSRIGGTWTSPPAAQVHPNGTLVVLGLGSDEQLYRATKAVGSPAPWAFSQVP